MKFKFVVTAALLVIAAVVIGILYWRRSVQLRQLDSSSTSTQTPTPSPATIIRLSTDGSITKFETPNQVIIEARGTLTELKKTSDTVLGKLQLAGPKNSIPLSFGFSQTGLIPFNKSELELEVIQGSDAANRLIIGSQILFRVVSIKNPSENEADKTYQAQQAAVQSVLVDVAAQGTNILTPDFNFVVDQLGFVNK